MTALGIRAGTPEGPPPAPSPDLAAGRAPAARRAPAPPAPPSRDVGGFVQRYLLEQADLTAVARFAQRHVDADGPLLADRYRQLLPFARPGEGEQYAFEVDLDACTGCKACVTACRSLNGLDEDESWRTVSTVAVRATNGDGAVFPVAIDAHVTAACHHCVEPACLVGCPADAYEKDPRTGIVAHLDDQCIGCRYCTLACPYEVPRYNEARGIVRKCDMCRDRLAADEAPACVQGCPNGAIRVTLVGRDTTRRAAAGAVLVPGAPPSAITAPSTRFRSTRLPTAGDPVARAARPSEDHPPLARMLVLSQVSIGALVVAVAARALGLALPAAAVAAGTAVGILAMVASATHLGRPRHALRAVLGWRHSWVSREVVAASAYLGAATLASVAPAAPVPPPLVLAVGIVAAALGVLTVACSAMIYVVTRRSWWRARLTGTRFALTSLVGGSALVAAVAAAAGAPAPGLALLAATGGAVKLLWEAAVLGRGRRDAALAPSVALVRTHLRRAMARRHLVGALGVVAALGAALAAASAPAPAATATALVALVALVAGELAERSLFFTASLPPGAGGGA